MLLGLKRNKEGRKEMAAPTDGGKERSLCVKGRAQPQPGASGRVQSQKGGWGGEPDRRPDGKGQTKEKAR